MVPLFMTALYFTAIRVAQCCMASKPPLDVRQTMWVYNIHQVFINLYLVVNMILHKVRTGAPLWGSVLVDDDPWLPFLLYMHYHNKYLEYMGDGGSEITDPPSLRHVLHDTAQAPRSDNNAACVPPRHHALDVVCGSASRPRWGCLVWGVFECLRACVDVLLLFVHHGGHFVSLEAMVGGNTDVSISGLLGPRSVQTVHTVGARCTPL